MLPGQQPPTTLSFSAPPTLQPFFLNAFHKGSLKTGAPGKAGQPSVPKKVPPARPSGRCHNAGVSSPSHVESSPQSSSGSRGLGLLLSRRAAEQVTGFPGKQTWVGSLTNPPAALETFRMGSWLLIHLAKLSHQHRFLQRVGLPLESSGTAQCSAALRPPSGCEVCCLSGPIVAPKPALQGERWGKREVPAPSRARRRLNKAREMPSLSLQSPRGVPPRGEMRLSPSRNSLVVVCGVVALVLKIPARAFQLTGRGSLPHAPAASTQGTEYTEGAGLLGAARRRARREGGDGLSKQP